MQRFVYVVLFPITKLCLGVANLFLLVMRKDNDVDEGAVWRPQDQCQIKQESGDLKEEGRRMIDSIFEFDDLLAYEIMTSMNWMFLWLIYRTIKTSISKSTELRHSRIPICDADIDNIIGTSVKDYLLKEFLLI